MENKPKPTVFGIIFAEKSDVENSSSYTLSEYMPDLSKIVKTDAKLKILEKTITDGKLELFGEFIYNVLYSAENGALKTICFREDFDKSYDIKNDAGEKNYISVRSVPIFENARIEGKRTLSARSKISLSVEIFDMSEKSFFEGNTENDECDIEYLNKDIDCACVSFCESSKVLIEESFELEAGMAEISDIADVSGHVCVKSVTLSEGRAQINAEMTVFCLYAAKGEDMQEYVSLEKTFPFSSDIEMQGADGDWESIARADLLTVSCDSADDNFGQTRVIEVTASVRFDICTVKNTKSTFVADMYSTRSELLPKKENVHIFTLVGSFKDLLEHTEKVRFELRGIVDIISSSLNLSFSNPEFSDGAVYLPARGVLKILGMKENGEIDSRTSPINLHLRERSIPTELSQQKLKWLNFCSVCRHECEIMGGELVLKLWVNENILAMNEENVSVVCDYEKGESTQNSKKCSFTIYYPEKGESAWNVAKSHGVSCMKMCRENGILSDTIEKEKPVVVR